MIKYLLVLATLLFFAVALVFTHFFFEIKEFVLKLYRKVFKKDEPKEKKTKSETYQKAEKIVVIVLTALTMAMFLVRFMCYDDIQWISGWEKYQKIGEMPQSKFNAVIGELCLWLVVPANLLLFMRTFSEEKTASWFVKFISLPVLLVSIIFMKQTEINMIGVAHDSLSEFTLLEIMFPLELGETFALAIYYLIKDLKVRIALPEYFLYFLG